MDWVCVRNVSDSLVTRFGSGIHASYLTGAACALFLAGLFDGGWNPWLAGPIVFGGFFCTVLHIALAHVFQHLAEHDIAVFTLPFHVATWSLLLGALRYRHLPVSLAAPSLVNITKESEREWSGWEETELGFAVLRGVAQVFLMEEWVSGRLLGRALGISLLLAFTGGLLFASWLWR